MKTLIIKSFLLFISTISLTHAIGQTAELTIEVTGIKDVKGKIFIIVSPSETPENPIYDRITVEKKGSAVCYLKNIPIGKVVVSIFQDINDNYKLDVDEQNIPVEPCYKKEKIKIEAGTNTLNAKLINVKEMMGSQPAEQ